MEFHLPLFFYYKPFSNVNIKTKKKGRDLERLAGIQFPEYYSKLASDTIIHKPLCICNRRNRQVSYAANPSLEQRKETMRSIQEMKKPDIPLQMKDESVR